METSSTPGLLNQTNFFGRKIGSDAGSITGMFPCINLFGPGKFVSRLVAPPGHADRAEDEEAVLGLLPVTGPSIPNRVRQGTLNPVRPRRNSPSDGPVAEQCEGITPTNNPPKAQPGRLTSRGRERSGPPTAGRTGRASALNGVSTCSPSTASDRPQAGREGRRTADV